MSCVGLEIQPPTLGNCPDITGSWASSNFDFMQVFQGNTHDVIKDATMILQIDEQEGCLFSGDNIWGNGRLGGTETIAGSLNPDTGEIIIVEVGNHPRGSSSGRMTGHHIGNRINLVYTGLGQHGDLAEAFSTVLTNGIDPIAPLRCPEITGSWRSNIYSVFNVYADGRVEEADRLPMKLDIQAQEGCTFRALNTWTDGTNGGSEGIAGIIEPETGLITMQELDPHPETGSSARVWGRLVSADEIHWTYAGRTSDEQMGQAIHLALSKSGIPKDRKACPDLLGTFSSLEPHNSLIVEANGSTRDLEVPHSAIEITDQEGCRLAGFHHWENSRGAVVPEAFIGVMDGESDRIHMIEVGDTPPAGALGVMVARLADEKYLVQSYTGLSPENYFAQVYGVILAKE